MIKVLKANCSWGHWFSRLIVPWLMVLAANSSGATGSAATGSVAKNSRSIGPITDKSNRVMLTKTQ